LGNCFFKRGKKRLEGARLIRAAVLQDYAPAQYELGKFYQGVKKNKLLAACLYKMAADNRHHGAMIELDQLDLSKVMLADV
jgi:TPR repeat protein